MDWTRIFTDLRKRDSSAPNFAKALFDGDSWFLRGLGFGENYKDAPVEVTGEKRDIIKAIGEYAQEKDLLKKPVPQQATSVQAEKADKPDKEESKIKIPVSSESSSTQLASISHELPEVFKDWSSYVSREQGGVSYQISEQAYNNLARTDEARQVSIAFVGDTFSEESEHEDLLGKMIAAMKLEQGEYLRFFYRDDLNDEDYLYSLLNELWLVKPRYVIGLGAKVTSMLMKKKDRLSKIHGKFFPTKIVNLSDESSVSMEIVPVFHPDFLRINPSMKRAAWTDLQKIMHKLEQ